MDSVNNTVNNIAAAASKVIWGEPQGTTDAANATVVPETKGTEPLSGEMGDTKKGEPYDKGNLDSTNTETTTTTTNPPPTPPPPYHPPAKPRNPSTPPAPPPPPTSSPKPSPTPTSRPYHPKTPRPPVSKPRLRNR